MPSTTNQVLRLVVFFTPAASIPIVGPALSVAFVQSHKHRILSAAVIGRDLKGERSLRTIQSEISPRLGEISTISVTLLLLIIVSASRRSQEHMYHL